MNTESLIDLTLKWKRHSISQKTDLRAKLIDACAKHEGWEESAIALIDEAIMPIIRQHKAGMSCDDEGCPHYGKPHSHGNPSEICPHGNPAGTRGCIACTFPVKTSEISDAADRYVKYGLGQQGVHYKHVPEPVSVDNGGVASALSSSPVRDAASACRDDNPSPSTPHQPVGRTLFDPNIHCDAERVIAWIDNPKRKSAQMAFTEGLERQIAYRFEDTAMKRELGIQHIRDLVGDAYMEGFSDGLCNAGSEFCDYKEEAEQDWKRSSALQEINRIEGEKP